MSDKGQVKKIFPCRAPFVPYPTSLLQAEIRTFLDSQVEWLLVRASGKTFSLESAEIEISSERERTLFSFLDDKGFQTWRVADCKIERGKIILDLSRNFGRETEKIKLVPRISVKELSATVELARLEKANEIGKIIEENIRGARLLRVSLNEKNGRFAQIIFENQRAAQTVVLADVSAALTSEMLLSAAILRLAKLENRKKNPIGRLWILSERKQSKNLQKLHALLEDDWKAKIKIVEISREKDGKAKLKELESLRISALWKAKSKDVKPTEDAQTSEAARKIIELAPAEIDVVFSRHGETLRFSGLPFARVRKVFEREKVWFGIERNRRILSEETQKDLLELIENLKKYRRHASPNKRHAFYALAPEAWLEAILRRNIRLLDANLILSPVYHQFRAERDKIDLLALRRDGRLVIIELKTAIDREMIFQAADYWRKIELQRRTGNLKKMRIFGDAEISEKPALIYLVAPTFSFHPDFEFLTRTISPEIGICRFDLNENWREQIRVLRRR
ncbi:MAG TPA: hypothetical protein VGC76_13035 [Pyrinomonadaceae bacterium]|jgi:hypothetical protein